ncbi:hypothetical protein DSAG12_02209 [Promethearchaeum syntrophicum]|uniref:CorA-like Mg2+ transporter protein n=1 Tax=Promethearchaeum syntrophicum TaxID=2594042 RepID=A0A5B9DAW1_9ARCH|nr:hypothetical protein [Candidatus Prometheoarchaeum syntrophicum]QEE16379.1 hypothetical protein DSAG12_02209 [Candidatus Prometheoarchaeum syntrophicum]
MINELNEFRLKFKEQWWCVSAFTDLDNENLTDEIEKLNKYTKNQLSSFKESDINPRFVPDANDRQKIAFLSQNLQIELTWDNYIDNFNFKTDNYTYDKLGYLLFRIRLKDNSSVNIFDVRPNYLQQIIFHVWFGLTKKFQFEFKFDDSTPPYIVSVCSGTNNNSVIEWKKENIHKYKSELGQWIQLYSGQFPDYRDELYERRIEVDLSNRTSEMHFINRNSGLIYMEPDNYKRFFIKDKDSPDSSGYMHNTVVRTIIQIRSIAFAMIVVSNEVDKDTGQLGSDEFMAKKSKEIKDNLEKTNKLKLILQKTLSPFFSDLTRSHRQHYHAVLKRCVEINEIEKNWKLILEKIDSNTQEMNSIFLDKQEEASDRQEKILNMVNIILGAGIVFDIIGFIISEESVQKLIVQIIGGGLLLFLVVLFLKLYGPKRKKKTKKKESEKGEED